VHEGALQTDGNSQRPLHGTEGWPFTTRPCRFGPGESLIRSSLRGLGTCGTICDGTVSFGLILATCQGPPAEVTGRDVDLQGLKETTQRWIHGIRDNQDLTLLDELASPDYVYRVPGQEDVHAAGLPELLATLHAAFPDLHNTIEQQVAEEGIVVTRGTTHGTQLGPFGELEATGRTVALPWVMVTRFEQGRIVEDWELYNELSLETQLGAVSSPAS